jgi:hypothetical protein
MNTITSQPQIKETVDTARFLSFEEKREAYFSESKLNQFLDQILEFKKLIALKTNKIEELTEKMELITWLDQLDEESLLLINDLISAVRDLHTSLFRQFKSVETLLEKHVGETEILAFKDAIDDLNDVSNDLESRFFYFSKNEEFINITKELSLL